MRPGSIPDATIPINAPSDQPTQSKVCRPRSVATSNMSLGMGLEAVGSRRGGFAAAAATQIHRDNLTLAIGDQTAREVVEAVHIGRQAVYGEDQRCFRFTEPLRVHSPRREIEIELLSHRCHIIGRRFTPAG